MKLSDAFDWHHHATEDEMFLVIAGRLRMHLRDGPIDLGPGEFLVVPHGVEHCPDAIEEPCHVLLVEPGTTLNTGTDVTDRTRATLERIDRYPPPLHPSSRRKPGPRLASRAARGLGPGFRRDDG
ncbi:cupin domain-containing protein [Sphingomonas sp.]|uniref:cupin domain-containing protein n=1 Tax=Sphingomonas sp. TaxID=28214 RepID=UPI0025EBBAB7|nr:cupin domain-containing protein [Sphingomonas sp.]